MNEKIKQLIEDWKSSLKWIGDFPLLFPDSGEYRRGRAETLDICIKELEEVIISSVKKTGE